MHVQESNYGVNVGLARKKCENASIIKVGWGHIVMNVKLRMFAYKIERRGTSELSQIEDLEDN